MEPPEGDGLRREVVRGAALLAVVVGMLAVGTVEPDAVTLDAAAAATAALGAAVASASPAPFFAAGLLAGGLSLALRTGFGPFGRVDADGGAADWTACEVCGHRVGGSREACRYCRTPTDADDREG